jgi:hypothetical protein
VTEPDGLRQRIVPGQHERQHAPLRLKLVEEAESPPEGLFLAGALHLEPADLALQSRDVGLGSLHAVVQHGNLAALLSDLLLGVLELGQDRRLPLLGLRDLRALLLELPLLLLERALAVAEIWTLAPGLTLGAREARHEENGEQAGEDPRDHE